jgi:hypothetical protein
VTDNKERSDEQRGKREISGPGAADVIAAEGGADTPGTSDTKGMVQSRGEAPLTDASRLMPQLDDRTARAGDGSAEDEPNVPEGSRE